MASIAYDTSELITTLQDRGLIPTDQNLFDSTSFLRSCTQQMWTDICVDLMATRNQYLIWLEDQTIVAARQNYRIPHRAIGGKVEDVYLVNSDGTLRDMVLVPPQRIKEMMVTSTSAVSSPTMFYVEGGEVVLFPPPASSGATLRIRYAIRPGKLIAKTAAAKIATISTAGSYTRYFVALADTLPSWSTTNTVDIIAGKPIFQYLAIDVALGSVTPGVNGFVDILTTSVPTGAKAPVVGDWIALVEESPVPQVPAEYHALLAMLGLAEHLNALGDHEAADRVLLKATNERKSALTLVSPRVNAQVKKTINRNWFYGRRR